MSLQAAFRKRLLKHKDKQGKTTHHYHTSPAGRPEAHEHPSQDPAHQHRSPRPGVTQPRSMRGQKFTPAYGYASKEGQGGRSKQGKNFKKIPADNPYAGGHRNVEAAVMKAVRMVAKHKDKQGSTAHHGEGGRDPYVMGDWQAEERRHAEGQGRPYYGPDPIVIDPDETPAQRRTRWRARNEGV